MSQARERLDELCAAAWALAAASAHAEGGVPPELEGQVREVLAAAGLDGLDEIRSPHLMADLRSTLLQVADFAARAREGTLAPGWSHTDPVLLQAQGDMSASGVAMLTQQVFPQLGRPVRDFLDVGAGVASVAIEVCRQVDGLRAVGLEPQEAPLAIARRNVAEAGLAGRIELRRQLVQELADEAAFDVAWLPLTFFPADVLEAALVTVHRALRPGGLVVTGTLVHDGADLRAAAARLRAALWGGEQFGPDELERLARAAGYAEVRRGPRLGSGLTPMMLVRG